MEKSNGNEKADTTMQVTNETRTGLRAEIKIVPSWAWMLAVVAFGAAQWYFNIAMPRHSGAPPAWARAVLGVMAGIGAGCYLLFLGYINRDAKRRGMSPTLWTLVATLIPNGLGILLYFILRQPPSSACPQCGNAVQARFNFCPRCSYKLSPSCPQCQRVVAADDVYCPYCAASLRNQAAPTAGLPTE
jgi:RNA polymerase subunit RPABC4/transcription elongation factor Spt4